LLVYLKALLGRALREKKREIPASVGHKGAKEIRECIKVSVSNKRGNVFVGEFSVPIPGDFRVAKKPFPVL